MRVPFFLARRPDLYPVLYPVAVESKGSRYHRVGERPGELRSWSEIADGRQPSIGRCGAPSSFAAYLAQEFVQMLIRFLREDKFNAFDG